MKDEPATTTTATFDHDDYAPFLEAVHSHFQDTAGPAGGPFFTTDAADLFLAFLAALPDHERQHHTCHACRRFVEQYGGLVTIDGDGRTLPVMWPPDAPGFYGPALEAAARIVRKAKVTGAFLSRLPVWGQPVTGKWHHMAVTPPPALVSRLPRPSEAMAEKREEYGMLQRGLADFTPKTIKQALAILKADVLYRSEKVLGVAKWLHDLHTRRTAAKGKQAKDNLVWLAVATAPAGFCHVRTTMIGTLLEDIASGMALETVKRRFAEKMAPLQYQRPQAAPTAGNIAKAEKLFAEMGLAPALRRRYARLEEVLPHAIWAPVPAKKTEPEGGVFGHLKPKDANPAVAPMVPETTMTWVKFRDTVLPEAERIEFYVPRASTSYLGLLTAADPEAPPIIQWDRPEKRNPVSWYLYAYGSRPQTWNLTAGEWANVTALVPLPSQWDPERDYSHFAPGIVVLLKGCQDTSGQASVGLFPEILRGDLREVRATIEAYSRGAKAEGAEDADACGLDLRKGQRWNQKFRVTSKDGTQMVVTLDRWD